MVMKVLLKLPSGRAKRLYFPYRADSITLRELKEQLGREMPELDFGASHFKVR